MTVLVVGAVRGIGNEVAKRLVSLGHDVIGVGRHIRNADNNDTFEYIQTDIVNKEKLEDLLNNIRSTKYKLDKIDKPIKSESSYKVQDLLDICCKLAIEINNTSTGKKKTKKELYESIIQYF